MYYVFTKGYDVTLAIIQRYTLEPEKQRQKQRSFARTFTAHAKNTVKYGMNAATNQKNSIFHIVEAAIIAAIISK